MIPDSIFASKDLFDKSVNSLSGSPVTVVSGTIKEKLSNSGITTFALLSKSASPSIPALKMFGAWCSDIHCVSTMWYPSPGKMPSSGSVDQDVSIFIVSCSGCSYSCT